MNKTIGLIDVDGHNFPNLALMRISAWHKAMADFISREAALDMCDDDYDRIRIRGLPAADVRPVVRGKWGLDPQCPVCGEDRYKGLDADIWADWEPPFCPNCGADMRPYKDGRRGENDSG